MNKKYNCPFLGEIDLKKVGETSSNLMGETVVRTIYTDLQGHYYIDIWTSFKGTQEPMTIIHKNIVKIIIEAEEEKIKL